MNLSLNKRELNRCNCVLFVTTGWCHAEAHSVITVYSFWRRAGKDIFVTVQYKQDYCKLQVISSPTPLVLIKQMLLWIISLCPPHRYTL